MNLICFLVVSLAINTYAVPMFGLDTFPAWAALNPEIRQGDTLLKTGIVYLYCTLTVQVYREYRVYRGNEKVK